MAGIRERPVLNVGNIEFFGADIFQANIAFIGLINLGNILRGKIVRNRGNLSSILTGQIFREKEGGILIEIEEIRGRKGLITNGVQHSAPLNGLVFIPAGRNTKGNTGYRVGAKGGLVGNRIFIV